MRALRAAVVLGLGAISAHPGRPPSFGLQEQEPEPERRVRSSGMRNLRQPENEDAKVVAQPELLVVATGGVGTTAMMAELSTLPQLAAVMNGHHNENGLKHAPLSRLISEHSNEIKKVRRILYLWGDPTHAAESLYRRDYAAVQSVKVRTDPLADGTWMPPRWRDEYGPKGVPETIEAYAAAKGDIFQFYEHAVSYLQPCGEELRHGACRCPRDEQEGRRCGSGSVAPLDQRE